MDKLVLNLITTAIFSGLVVEGGGKFINYILNWLFEAFAAINKLEAIHRNQTLRKHKSRYTDIESKFTYSRNLKNFVIYSPQMHNQSQKSKIKCQVRKVKQKNLMGPTNNNINNKRSTKQCRQILLCFPIMVRTWAWPKIYIPLRNGMKGKGHKRFSFYH